MRWFALAAALLLAAACGGSAEEAALPGRPTHHTADGFRNPPGSPTRQTGTLGFVAFFAGRIFDFDVPTPPPGHQMSREAALAGYRALEGRETVTWLGHAAFLLRLNGKNILLDPFLDEYAGPYRHLGPKRFAPSPLAVADLPPIDLVVISHNHYDHLDEWTIEALPGKERITVIVPLKLGDFFRRRGYRNVIELDWYQSRTFDELTVHAVPAIHFSARGLFDRNETLWAGYMLETPRQRLYFSGDSAYHPTVFKEIGRKLGPPDLALICIGAYEPRRIMVATHTTPEEAVQLARDLGAKRMLGMHWGSIVLTEEPPFEPPVRFRAAARKAGFADGDAWLMVLGETRELPAR